MSVKLTSINLNLSAEFESKAEFKLTGFDVPSIKVSMEAICNNSIEIISSSDKSYIITNSSITIDLPRTTSMVKFTFHKAETRITDSRGRPITTINNNIIKYYPENTDYNFSRPDKDLFLTINYLNSLAIDTAGLDHTPIDESKPVIKPDDINRVPGHQLGPHRSSRAMAMFHMALFEVYIVFYGKFKSYLNLGRQNPGNVSITTRRAMIQAGFNILTFLYPSHNTRLNLLLENLMTNVIKVIDSEKTSANNIAFLVSNAVIEKRKDDKSDVEEKQVGTGENDYKVDNTEKGQWEPDPLGNNKTAVGSEWGKVTPFVLQTSHQFRCDQPPALDSKEYMMAFDDVKSNGGDGVETRTARSDDKTETGIFWAYDGTPSLCAPPRLYNQVTKKILYENNFPAENILYTLALINIAMADTAIACWESKYYYKLWRPITAIRKSDSDGNSDTIGDIDWTPLGAPFSNGKKINFTPPFPAYPSGHATFGATMFQILRNVFMKFLFVETVPFSFISDEYNGITTPGDTSTPGSTTPTPSPRPYIKRFYNSFRKAEEENAESRVYLGVHFCFDKTSGIKMGRDIGDHVFDNLYK
jgi:hypothetical protein